MKRAAVGGAAVSLTGRRWGDMKMNYDVGFSPRNGPDFFSKWTIGNPWGLGALGRKKVNWQTPVRDFPYAREP